MKVLNHKLKVSIIISYVIGYQPASVTTITADTGFYEVEHVG